VLRRDKFGLDSEYVAAISSPSYEKAFAKKLTGMNGAEAELEPDEREALLAVGRAMSMRAMAIGEGKTGGFAIPIALDPTVILTSTGAVSPLRELANVVTISASSEWKGVGSAGVSAHFRGEAEEVEDDSPELEQPTVKPQRADCFIPYSIESEDWAGIREELTRLMADAKNTLEAECAFVP
jgi:HK97 family phage major capsid protein